MRARRREPMAPGRVVVEMSPRAVAIVEALARLEGVPFAEWLHRALADVIDASVTVAAQRQGMAVDEWLARVWPRGRTR